MLANDGGRLGQGGDGWPGPGPGPGWPGPGWPGGGFPPSTPLLLAVVPASGPTAGGNIVLVVGLGLSSATGVSFGGTPATILARDPFGLAIAVTAPAHAAGTVPVTVITPSGPSNAVNYTYGALTLPPTAASINPTTGPVTGGTPFTITGTNLANAVVLFNGLPATGVTVNPAGTSLTGITPAGLAPGNVTVSVVTPAGITTVPGGFTYTGVPPTAASITPATGPAAGGTPFVIIGTGLTGGSVTIGGAAATGVSVNATGTLLVGITPAGTVGVQPVVVTTAGGTATVPGGFTYV
ncbi:IPT/TIG domain-containing protein [Streptomyces sp. 205]|uniref:IPT/TIG domain-containing protein n=2 Tax=Streptomyces coffeae TaxID=621382 RepID=A0ABS1NJN7_9ACTN|nr:IPT/TIG domain-containing protein [Streptomyces coffeae]